MMVLYWAQQRTYFKINKCCFGNGKGDVGSRVVKAM